MAARGAVPDANDYPVPVTMATLPVAATVEVGTAIQPTPAGAGRSLLSLNQLVTPPACTQPSYRGLNTATTTIATEEQKEEAPYQEWNRRA